MVSTHRIPALRERTIIGVGGMIPKPIDEMVEGYLDGFSDNRHNLPVHHNYSPIYAHGWLNGRDDRLGTPHAYAKMLRKQGEILLLEALI
jgi:hypothetical protein